MNGYLVKELMITHRPQLDANEYHIIYSEYGQESSYNLTINMSDLYGSVLSGDQLLISRVGGFSMDLASALQHYIYTKSQSWKPLGYTYEPVKFEPLTKQIEIKKFDNHKSFIHEYNEYYSNSKYITPPSEQYDYYVKVKQYLESDFGNPAAKISYYGEDQSGNPEASVSSLPGVYEQVNHPKPPEGDQLPNCTDSRTSIRQMIIHLNDGHRWTREAIADWLETLDVDLRFKTEDDKLRERRQQKLDSLTAKIAGLKDSIEIWNESIKEAHEKIKKLQDSIETLQQEDTNE